MKKSLKFLSAFLVLFVLHSCGGSSQLTKLPNGKYIDPILVGVWAGSEKGNQIKDVEKKWVMTRSKDGTFFIEFRVEYSKGEIHTNTEKGTWWVENGKFYEYHDYSQKTDVYSYKLLNDHQVKFRSEYLSMPHNNQSPYEFIDTKISSEP